MVGVGVGVGVVALLVRVHELVVRTGGLLALPARRGELEVRGLRGRGGRAGEGAAVVAGARRRFSSGYTCSPICNVYLVVECQAMMH